MTSLTELPATCRPRHYRFASELYLERFGDDGLLLVADRDLLLTIDAAAADLFAAARQAAGGGFFTMEQGVEWLAGQYDLDVQACRFKVRELLAFGLKQGLVCRAPSER